MKNTRFSASNKGFTLLEILLVVAAIAILAVIVIVAVNPAKQLADTRNAQRRANANTILNAVWQHAVDNKGTLHANIGTDTAQICPYGVTTGCEAGLSPNTATTSLDFLVPGYLADIPIDPNRVATSGCSVSGTCYTIKKDSNGRITITAPRAEEDGPSGATTTIIMKR